MKIKEIKPRDHEMVTYFRECIERVFGSLPFKMYVDYCSATLVGEDTPGLYFAFRSDPAGVYFEKFQKLERHQVMADIEEEFISKISEDISVAGMTLYHIRKLNQSDEKANMKDFSPSKLPMQIYPVWLN